VGVFIANNNLRDKSGRCFSGKQRPPDFTNRDIIATAVQSYGLSRDALQNRA